MTVILLTRDVIMQPVFMIMQPRNMLLMADRLEPRGTVRALRTVPQRALETLPHPLQHRSVRLLLHLQLVRMHHVRLVLPLLPPPRKRSHPPRVLKVRTNHQHVHKKVQVQRRRHKQRRARHSQRVQHPDDTPAHARYQAQVQHLHRTRHSPRIQHSALYSTRTRSHTLYSTLTRYIRHAHTRLTHALVYIPQFALASRIPKSNSILISFELEFATFEFARELFCFRELVRRIRELVRRNKPHQLLVLRFVVQQLPLAHHHNARTATARLHTKNTLTLRSPQPPLRRQPHKPPVPADHGVDTQHTELRGHHHAVAVLAARTAARA